MQYRHVPTGRTAADMNILCGTITVTKGAAETLSTSPITAHIRLAGLLYSSPVPRLASHCQCTVQ
jgi:hypothetical protein